MQIDEIRFNQEEWVGLVRQHEWALKRNKGQRETSLYRSAVPSATVDNLLIQEHKVGRVGNYQDLKRSGLTDEITTLDHQPHWTCIRDAVIEDTEKKSQLVVAMAQGVDFEDCNNDECPIDHLVTKNVLQVQQKSYMTSGSETESVKMREFITQSILDDDPVLLFKLNALATSPTFIYKVSEVKGNTDNLHPSIKDETRRKVYEDKGVVDVANYWYENYLGIGENAAMSKQQYQDVMDWIKKGGYKDSNDEDFMHLLAKLTIGE